MYYFSFLGTVNTCTWLSPPVEGKLMSSVRYSGISKDFYSKRIDKDRL